MKIVKSSVELLPQEIDILNKIELCGRVCYKSEEHIKIKSEEKFIKMIMKRGHESVLEHGSIIVEVDEDVYESVISIEPSYNTNEYDSYNKYLNFTTDDDRYVISGNIRSWRHLYKHINYLLTDFYCQEISELVRLAEHIKKENYILFYDLNEFEYELVEPMPKHKIKIITEKDLKTDEEKLAHTYRTFKFVTNRGVSHELVRHRTASFSQESTRFCKYTNDKFNNEVTFIDLRSAMELDNNIRDKSNDLKEMVYNRWYSACVKCENDYNDITDAGATPQIARDVLNNSTKTEMYMTSNLYDWINFMKQRTAPTAHPEAREVCIPALYMLKKEYNFFDDIIPAERDLKLWSYK